MGDTWLTVLQVVGVPTISAVGAYLVAKRSNRANEKTAQIQDRATEIDGMDRLVHNLETRLGKVEQANEKLGERVRSLEEERTKDKSLIRHLIDYIRTLRNIIRDAGLEVPDAPATLDIEGPLSREGIE